MSGRDGLVVDTPATNVCDGVEGTTGLAGAGVGAGVDVGSDGCGTGLGRLEPLVPVVVRKLTNLNCFSVILNGISPLWACATSS